MRYVTDRIEDFIAGLVTAGIGGFIIIEAMGYRMGSLTRMGPGYFPIILGVLMLVLALVMVLTAQPGTKLQRVEGGQLRGMFFLAAAFMAFTLTIESFGLMLAVALSVFLSALANPRTTLITALILAAFTASISALIFRVGLGLQIEAF